MNATVAPNADGMSLAVEKDCGTNGIVPWFLMTSLLYYHCDISLVSDARYDEMARTILADYDTVTHHHLPLILKADLTAGSLFALSWRNYPLTVRGGAVALLDAKTKKHLSDEARAILYSNEFTCPDHALDTYVYGPNGMTYRQYQKEMVAQWDDMIRRGKLTQEQKREFCQKIGVKITMAAPPPPPALPPPRVRQRPADIQAQITRPRVRTIQ